MDLVCQTTNVTRPGAPDGPHVLLATSVTTGGGVAPDGAAAPRWPSSSAAGRPRYDWARRPSRSDVLRAPLRAVPAAGRACGGELPGAADRGREPDPGRRPHPPPLHRGRRVQRGAGGADRGRADAVKRVGARQVWSRRATSPPRLWRRVRGPALVLGRGRDLQDLRPARGGQVYFTLRGEHVHRRVDEPGRLRAAAVPAPRRDPGARLRADGVLARPRSQVTMRVERLEPAGEGLLLARIEELKRAPGGRRPAGRGAQAAAAAAAAPRRAW